MASRKRKHDEELGRRDSNVGSAPASKTKPSTVNKLDKKLLQAVQNRKPNIVKELIDQGANPNGARDKKKGRTCLHWAICDADFPCLDAVDKEPGLGSPSTDDATATRRVRLSTILTRTNDSYTMSKDLLEAGADPLAVDPHGNTCLHLAAAGDRKGLEFMLLLEHARNPRIAELLNAPNEFGYTPLLVFALHHGSQHFLDRTKALKRLIAAGADVSVAADDGNTCLHFAGQEKEHIEIMLNAPGAANVINSANRLGVTPLQIAIQHSSLNVVERMIQLGADVNLSSPKGTCGESPLHIAARCGFDDKVKMLLKSGAKADAINSRGESVIFLVVKNRPKSSQTYTWAINTSTFRKEVYKALIQRGANVNDGGPGGYAPLKAIIECGNLDEIKFFVGLKNQGFFKPFKFSLLHAALSNQDNHSVVKYFLENRLCGVDEKDERGLTALYKIVNLKSEPYNDWSRLLVKLLLDAGANVDFKAKESPSILSIAISLEKWHTVFNLVRHISLLEIKNDHVDPDNLSTIEQAARAQAMHKDCKAELDMMKSAVIVGSITYFSILSRSSWIKNEGVVSMLETLDENVMKQRFPIYHDLVLLYFRQNQTRHKLIGKATKGLKQILCIDVDAFHDIAYKILQYLSHDDLVNLHKVIEL